MSSYSGLARGDLRHVGGGQIRFTTQGQEELAEMIKAGCDIRDVADYFCVTEEWVEKQIGPGGAQEELFRYCSAFFRKDVRIAQVKLMKENASMARFIGANVLNQSNNPAPTEPDSEKRVIGAMPTWKGDPEDWINAHKPKDAGGSTIDKIKSMRDAAKADEAPIIEHDPSPAEKTGEEPPSATDNQETS